MNDERHKIVPFGRINNNQTSYILHNLEELFFVKNLHSFIQSEKGTHPWIFLMFRFDCCIVGQEDVMEEG